MAALESRATAFLNSRPISPLQYWVFLLSGLCLFMDGYNAQALAYIVPILAKTWAVPAGAFGTAFAAGLIGSALGSLGLAPLADRFGRKRMMVGGAAILGLFTLACASATSISSLELLMLLAGLGNGAAIPNAIALVAEYAPDRRRATAVTAASTGLAVGGAMGAVVATLLVPRFGWAIVFVLGGVGALVLAMALQGLLPESLLFLLMRDAKGKHAFAILRKLVGSSEAARIEIIPEPPARRRSAIMILFRDGRGAITVTYGLLAFLTLIILYLLSNWLPTLIHSMGFSMQHASWSTAGFQLGAVVGMVVLGLLADRWDPIAVVLAAYVCAAICILGIGLSVSPLGVSLAAFGAGFTLIGAMGCNNAMLTRLYPTAARGTAIGWNLTIGRIGSIIGPTVTGFLLLAHVTPRHVLLLAAIPAICAATLLAVGKRAIERMAGAL